MKMKFSKDVKHLRLGESVENVKMLFAGKSFNGQPTRCGAKWNKGFENGCFALRESPRRMEKSYTYRFQSLYAVQRRYYDNGRVYDFPRCLSRCPLERLYCPWFDRPGKTGLSEVSLLPPCQHAGEQCRACCTVRCWDKFSHNELAPDDDEVCRCDLCLTQDQDLGEVQGGFKKLYTRTALEGESLRVFTNSVNQLDHVHAREEKAVLRAVARARSHKEKVNALRSALSAVDLQAKEKLKKRSLRRASQRERKAQLNSVQSGFSSLFGKAVDPQTVAKSVVSVATLAAVLASDAAVYVKVASFVEFLSHLHTRMLASGTAVAAADRVYAELRKLVEAAMYRTFDVQVSMDPTASPVTEVQMDGRNIVRENAPLHRARALPGDGGRVIDAVAALTSFAKNGLKTVVQSELVDYFKKALGAVLSVFWGTASGIQSWALHAGGISFLKIDYQLMDASDLVQFCLDLSDFIVKKFRDYMDSGFDPEVLFLHSADFGVHNDLVSYCETAVSEFSLMTLVAWEEKYGPPGNPAGAKAILLQDIVKALNFFMRETSLQEKSLLYASQTGALASRARSLKARFEALIASKRKKKVPFSMVLIGASGIGKSYMNDLIVKSILKYHGYITRDNPFDPSMIGLLTPGEFDSGLSSQTLALLVDDIGQWASKQAAQNLGAKIIEQINNIATPSNQAHLEGKGTVVPHPIVMLGSSNDPTLGAGDSVKTPVAMMRRFQYHVTVKVKPEWCLGLSLDLSKAHLFPKIGDFPDVYDIVIDRIIPADNAMSYIREQVFPAPGDGPVGSFPDAMAFLLEKSMIHRLQQEAAVEGASEMGDLVCPHDEVMIMCQVCMPRRAPAGAQANGAAAQPAPAGPPQAVPPVAAPAGIADGVQTGVYQYLSEAVTYLREVTSVAALGEVNATAMWWDGHGADPSRVQASNMRVRAALALVRRYPSLVRLPYAVMYACAKKAHLLNPRLRNWHNWQLYWQQYAMEHVPDLPRRTGETEIAYQQRTESDRMDRERLGYANPFTVLPEVYVAHVPFDQACLVLASLIHQPVGRRDGFLSTFGHTDLNDNANDTRAVRAWYGTPVYQRPLNWLMSRWFAVVSAQLVTFIAIVLGAVLVYKAMKLLTPKSFSAVQMGEEDRDFAWRTRDASPTCKVSTMTLGAALEAVTGSMFVLTCNSGDGVVVFKNTGFFVDSRVGLVSSHFLRNCPVDRTTDPAGKIRFELRWKGGIRYLTVPVSNVKDMGNDMSCVLFDGMEDTPNVAKFIVPTTRVNSLLAAGARMACIGFDMDAFDRDGSLTNIVMKCGKQAPVVPGFLKVAAAAGCTVDKAMLAAFECQDYTQFKRGNCGSIYVVPAEGAQGGLAVVGYHIGVSRQPPTSVLPERASPVMVKMSSVDHGLRSVFVKPFQKPTTVDIEMPLSDVGSIHTGNMSYVRDALMKQGTNTYVDGFGALRACGHSGASSFGTTLSARLPAVSFKSSVFPRRNAAESRAIWGVEEGYKPPPVRSALQPDAPSQRTILHRALGLFYDVGGSYDDRRVGLDYDPSFVQEAVCQFSNKLHTNYRHYPIDKLLPLPSETVVNGLKGGWRSLRWTSSAGHGVAGTNSSLRDERRPYLTKCGDVWTLSEHTEQLLERQAQGYRDGKGNDSVFVVSIKNEPVKLSKEFPRTFYAGSLQFNLFHRKYTGGLYKMFTDNPLGAELSLGVDPLSSDWNAIADYLHLDDDDWLVFGGDFETFDVRQCYILALAAISCLSRLMRALGVPRDVRKAVIGSLFDVITPTYFVGGDYVRAKGTGPSGHFWTTVLNGLIVSILVRIAWFRSNATVQGPTGVIPDFEGCVRMLTGGDDHLVAVHKSVRHLLNAVLLQEEARRFGWNYTDPTKMATVKPFLGPDEVDFLKRGFVKTGRLWTAPLKQSSIVKMTTWGVVSKKVDEQEVLSSVCRSAVRESLVHTSDFYARCQRVCEALARHYDGEGTALVVSTKGLRDELVVSGFLGMGQEELFERELRRAYQRKSRFSRVTWSSSDEFVSSPVVMEDTECLDDDCSVSAEAVFTDLVDDHFTAVQSGTLTGASLARFQRVANPIFEYEGVEEEKAGVAQPDIVGSTVSKLGVDAFTLPLREIFIGKTEFAVGANSVVDYYPFNTWVSDAAVSSKLEGIPRWRLRGRIRAVVTTSPFSVGRFILAWHPCPQRDDQWNNIWGVPAAKRTTVASLTQTIAQDLNHVIIDGTMGGEYFLDIAPLLDVPYMTGSASQYAYGHLMLIPMVNVADTSQAATNKIVVRIYMQPMDVEFEGSSANQAVQSGELLKEFGGKVKSAFGIKPGSLTSALADAAGGAAMRYAGLSRPAVDTVHFVAATEHNFAYTDGNDQVTVLGGNSCLSRGSVDPGSLGDDHDPMEMSELTQRESFVKTITFPAAEGRLFVYGVTPMMVASQVITAPAQTWYLPTALAHAGLVHRYWRGSIIYRFSVIASATTTGVITFHRELSTVPTAASGDSVHLNKTFVLDLSKERDIEICVPFDAKQMALPTQGVTAYDVTASGAVATDPTWNGMIYCDLSTVARSSGLTPPAYLCVYVRGGPDFEYFWPTLNAVEQYEIPSVLQSGANFTPDIRVTRKVSCQEMSTPAAPVPYGMWLLEPSSSIRRLLKRYTICRVSGFDSTVLGTNVEVINADTFTRVPIPYRLVSVGEWLYSYATSGDTLSLQTFIGWFSPLYFARRGSVRYKMRYTTNPNASISTIRARLGSRVSASAFQTDAVRRVEQIGSSTFTPTGDTAVFYRKAYVANTCDSTGGSGDAVAVNGFLSFEVPDYNPTLFHYSKDNLTQPTGPGEYFSVFLHSRPGTLGSGYRAEMNVAAGDDFALGRFAYIPFYRTGPT